MKKMICRIMSIVMAVMAALSLLAAVTVTGGVVLDLSNIARTVFCGAAILFTSISVLSWKTEGGEYRKVKAIVWLVAVAVIIVLTIVCSVYRVPAAELVNG